MRSSLVKLTGAAALVAALTSCSVSPSSFCYGVPVQNGAIPQLIYPVPGYNKVPDNATFIVVAYPGDASLAQTITLSQKGGSTVALGPLGAAPKDIPKPHAQTLPGQGALFGVTLPALAPHTVYSVNYRYVNTATLCGQTTTTSVLMGVFHTQ
jgi:hypothetical protein